MNGTQRLVILIGSVRQGRFGPMAANRVAQQAADHGVFDVDVVDLADLDIPLVLPAEVPSPG